MASRIKVAGTLLALCATSIRVACIFLIQSISIKYLGDLLCIRFAGFSDWIGNNTVNYQLSVTAIPVLLPSNL